MGFLDRLSFTERRRRRLAKKVDRLDRLETKNTITEPISISGLAMTAMRGAAQLGFILPNQASNALSGLVRPTDVAKGAGGPASKPIVRNLLKPLPDIEPGRHTGGAGGSSSAESGTAKSAPKSTSSDWLDLNTPPAADASDPHGISSPWQPAKRPGGGAALPPRGGSSGSAQVRPSSRGAITPLRLPMSTPAASNAGGASAALLAAVAGASSAGSASTGGAAMASTVSLVHAAPAGSSGQSAQSGQGTGGPTANPDGGLGGGSGSSGSSGGTPVSSIPDPTSGNSSGPIMESFPYFAMYVLVNNNGIVL